MKFKKVLIVLIFCMITMGFQVDAHSSTIKWYSFEEGVALGKAQGRPLYLNFMADWCGYCRKMDKYTYSDTKIIAYLNEHFISIKVNVDQDGRIAAFYKVRPIPDHVFLNANGKPIGRAAKAGYKNSEEFMKLLMAVKDAAQK